MNKVQILFGQKIIALGSEKSWGQSDFSYAADKSSRAIEKLENGKVNPTRYRLHEVAIALDVPLSALVDF